MSSLRRSFRRWWQPPRRASEREEERSVTFLELFYDLVYVVLISQLAHALSGHVTPAGVGAFAFLFVTVWLAWLNGAMYHDLHGNDDLRTRVFTFLQMFTVAAMAVFAHSALGEGSVGFALSFAAYQLILTYLWWRTGVHDPDHRPLSRPYSATFLITTLLFVVSAFIPPPWRFYLWGLALLLSLLLPLFILNMGKINPRIQAELDRTTDISPSAVERFGLFTIIVLGEVIVGVVAGVAGHHHLSWLVGITAGLGMLIAIGMWWIYFDFVSQHAPLSGRGTIARWLYLHLPMTMGIAATGAAVLNVVEHAGEPLTGEVRWLLVGAIALALVCIAILMRTIQIPAEYYRVYRTGGIVTLISGLVILLLGFSGMSAIPLLIVLSLLMLTPIFYGLKVWIQMLGGEEIALT
jgi:low temperature requirement protein LtrA